MMKVRYGCVPMGSWYGWIVMLGTFSRYGHAFLEVEFSSGAREVYEGRPGGLGKASRRVKRRYERQAVYSPWLGISDDEENAALNYLADVDGRKYDWVNIADFTLHFFGIPFCIDRNESDSKLICSVFVHKFFKRILGLNLFPGKDDHEISPGDLADAKVMNYLHTTYDNSEIYGSSNAKLPD